MNVVYAVLRSFGRISCHMANKHINGGKFRRGKLWYQSCRRCGKVKETSEPVKRVAK